MPSSRIAAYLDYQVAGHDGGVGQRRDEILRNAVATGWIGPYEADSRAVGDNEPGNEDTRSVDVVDPFIWVVCSGGASGHADQGATVTLGGVRDAVARRVV